MTGEGVWVHGERGTGEGEGVGWRGDASSMRSGESKSEEPKGERFSMKRGVVLTGVESSRTGLISLYHQSKYPSGRVGVEG